MEATGRSDNLKTIVGMLLKKDKARASDDGKKVMIPKVSVFSAPGSPTSSPSNTKTSLPVTGESEAALKSAAAKARFKQIVKKVIINNRKKVALKAIEDASAYLEERRARGGLFPSATSSNRRTSSVYGLHSEVRRLNLEAHLESLHTVNMKCNNLDYFVNLANGHNN